MAIRGLNTKNINRALIYSHYPHYPHKDSITEVELINNMYETEVHGINGFSECAFSFAILYGDFINEVVVSEEKKQRSEKLTKAEFENLRKRLVHNCPKKEICHRCSIENGDCRLLHGWKKEESSDNYTYSYPILGEYLPDLKKVVLYWNNIDNACGKPTYNGVLSTYIHELFHAYFHYVTEQKQAEYNYIKEIEEAMTEFCTLVFIRFMKNECSVEWYDIFDWVSERIGKKQNIAGGLPAYGFGRYLFDNIPEDEAFDWINKYAERLGYIDEEDRLVKQYKQMIYPCYPTEPNKCLELLRKILFETKNKPIKPRNVKDNCKNTMWNKTTDTGKIGNYVYGLAIPLHGSTYIVKYVGQASSGNIERCFQHGEEAKGYLAGRGTSNVKKVEMINYFASNGDFEIIILAHQVPQDQLDTMENIYRQMADYGALLFTINQNEIAFENNLTNIANTHNNKLTVGSMVVKPMTVKQINNEYAQKVYLQSQDIADKLGSKKDILYVLNHPGIQPDGYIGWWRFGQASLDSVDWIVCVGNNDMIEYVFSVNDIRFETRNYKSKSGNIVKKKGFKADELYNHIEKLKPIDGVPCFDVNGKGWNPYGNAFTYHSHLIR